MQNYTHFLVKSNQTETKRADIDYILGYDRNKIRNAIERGLAVHIVYGMIAVLAFSSNLVFCLAMKRKGKPLRTSHDVLIYTLAIADVLTGLFIIITPSYVINMSSYPVPGGIAGEIFCRLIFSKFFIFVFGKGSVLTIACLAVERWLFLIKPRSYQTTISPRKLYKCIAFIWLSCIGLQSYKLFYVRYFRHSCFFIPLPFGKSEETAVIIVYVSFTYFLPTAITWAAFLHIFIKTNKLNALRVNRGKKEKRLLLRMCAITSALLTVCWFPTEVSYVLNQYGFPILNFGTPFRDFTVALALANSFVNPWIYALSNRKYRRVLLEFLHLTKRRS